MWFCRRRRPLLAVAVALAGPLAAQGPAGLAGVVISEAAHGPSITSPTGPAMPSYIELVNRKIANPVYPAPVVLNGATITTTVNGASFTVTLPAQPPTLHVGGNVQPPPAPQPPPPTTGYPGPVLLIAEFPFPASASIPANVQVVIAPALFTGPQAAFCAPGASTEVCLAMPGAPTVASDALVVPPLLGVVGCAPPSAFVFGTAPGPGLFANGSGHVSRWTYVDSNTNIDFDDGFLPSPGVVNPEMSHVDGFLFADAAPPGVPHPVPDLGAPLAFNTAGLPGTSTYSFVAGASPRVSAVKFHNASPPYDRLVTDPAFDRVLAGQASIGGAFTASTAAPFPGFPGYLDNLTLLGNSLVITAPALSPGGNPGVLVMNMGPSTLVAAVAQEHPAEPGDYRIAKTFTDGLTDSGSIGTGDLSDSQSDSLPGSTGGNNVWCEVIVYDAAGNSYKGKAKNWPPSGCTGPRLAMGSSAGTGDGTVIDYCFNPGATVFNLLSGTPAVGCGGPLLVGLCPDAWTTWLLTPLMPLGTPPFHITTDAAGVFGWTVPAPTLLALVGLSFEGVGIEYNGAGIVQISPVATVTF
ncbi:MAG TPA: hypothetical protein VEI02_02410 [Planctomycetota bacterium]|nr:hypothetical protein [Planctomycetota bacterium]